MKKKFFVNMPRLTSEQKVLVEENFKLIPHVAKKLVGCGRDFNDMIQDGAFGLMRAAQKYNNSHGKFSTYAPIWIKQAILRGMNNNNRTRAVPVFRQDALRRWEKLTHKVTIKGETLTKRELKFLQEFNPEPYLAAMKQDISLNAAPKGALMRGNEEAELIDFIPDTSGPSVFESATYSELCDRIQSVLKTLNHNERLVISLRFGLDGEPKTLDEVSHIIKRTKERVRQIECDALIKLKHPGRNKVLREYFSQTL